MLPLLGSNLKFRILSNVMSFLILVGNVKKSLALKRPGILIVVRYLFKDYSAAASVAVSSA